MQTNIIKLGLAAAVSAGLAACSSGGSSDGGTLTGDGTLTIGLIDAPVNNATKVCVDLVQVNVKPQEGTALEFPYSPAEPGAGDPPPACDDGQINLLDFTDPDNAELLVDEAGVEPGRYNWIELVVNAELDGINDSYVEQTDGAIHELRVPSGSVRLVSGFDIVAGEHAHFTIDWDVRKGLVDPPGMPGMLLRPAFRIIDMTASARLEGTVDLALISGDEASNCFADDASDAGVGNVVYVFEALGDTPPDDHDGNAPDPQVMVDVDGNGGIYTYRTRLAPGDYSVAFTCEGENDLPPDDGSANDDDIVFLGPVHITVEDGDTATVDFPAAETSI